MGGKARRAVHGRVCATGAQRVQRGVRQLGFVCAALAATWLGSAGRAGAIEFFDGRLEGHGYFESSVRALARDFSAADDWDLAQWYQIFNLEIEAGIAPDGFGPLDLVTAFARIEVRYDCVWRRGCWIFPSADAYGDRADHLPLRLLDARRSGVSGQMWDGDTRKYREIPLARQGLPFRFDGDGGRSPIRLGNVPGFATLAGIPGADGMLGTPDDPFDFYLDHLLGSHCIFGARKTKGTELGNGNQVLPHDPGCKIRNIAPMSDKPNPLRAGDISPLTGMGGSAALPLRPAPERDWMAAPTNGSVAQGLWLPNERFAELARDGEFDNFDQNFRQEELEWNRGASQQDEKELKELYFDIEAFDSRLWIRAGRQNIVWGKTELFRTTDNFNPQDLALASLPSLEESRVALWALRAVWSFYEVGPLEDVRLELAANFDQIEPNDLGRCGEPYSPLPVCDKTFGLIAHGVTGAALAGEIRPDDPWRSSKGLEYGARLEFRWDRFSVAISDFYGYEDFGYADIVFRYSRNVDPVSGRPRVSESSGRCRSGTEKDCLRESNALERHSVNQTIFHFICATSIGFSSLDFASCGQTVFNSKLLADPTNALSPTVAIALTNILSGQNSGGLPITHGAALLETLGGFVSGTPGSLSSPTMVALNRFPNVNRYISAGAGVTAFCVVTFGSFCPTPLVPLNMDPRDGPAAVPFGLTPDGVSPWAVSGLSPFLTNEQEALLGCGPFYGTNCDLDGIDLMNAEATALLQSFPGIEGTFFEWDTTDRRRAQPGTVGFEGGPVCTRFEGGKLTMLPGCRGPRDRGYSVNVDGSTTGQRHPFTGQQFRSEMATVSWNALMGLVANSTPADPNDPQIDEFDANRPFRKGGCSFAQPYWCGTVRGIFSVTGVQRDIVRAGGNGRFGRRDFTWAGGSELVLRYAKRNVLGVSVDFAEDVTKSNWSFEFAWIDDTPFTNNDEFDGLTDASTYNLTISVDRPTFINFLNANRTFFFNSQWFFQYTEGWEPGFTSNGPWNVLATFTVTTGYQQDRLLPSLTFVYDFQSNSGAVLPEISYSFSANFSASFGVALFAGRFEPKRTALVPAVLPERVGSHAYTAWTENALAVVRERDEVFLRLRYTF